MAIIIEGLDNSGKSTLAAFLAEHLDCIVIESEGPPRWPGEINERVVKYRQLPNNTIFVRHPCVSQVIYGKHRGAGEDVVDPDLISQFYRDGHLFIYCDPLNRGMAGHSEREGIDKPEHVSAIVAHYNCLLKDYREWAVSHAFMVYRIGDSEMRLLCALQTLGWNGYAQTTSISPSHGF